MVMVVNGLGLGRWWWWWMG